LQWLKRIRVTVAIISLTSINFLFFDFGNLIPVQITSAILSTQVIPTLIHSFVAVGTASIVLAVILIGTMLFGRVYCSTLCPLGIIQDLFIRIAKIINRRRRFHFQKPLYSFHYLLFIVTTLLFILGSTFLLNLFEPFSANGRILSNLINPIVVSINNAFAYLLGLLGIMTLFHIQLLHVSFISILASVCMFGLVGYLSYYHGRLFCNLLCPTGAFLGLLSRFSLFKIVIDLNNCKECGLCERVCKSNCIKSDSKEIDFAACIGCFNCLDACPTVGMSYRRNSKKSLDLPMVSNRKRREVLKTSMLPVLGIIISEIGKDSTDKDFQYKESKKIPIAPPGAVSIERYSNICTACHLCVNSCPTQVLFPSFIEYGITGIFQPKMNYDASYCNYDCVLCGEVCPTGAILPLEVPSKKETQIGKAIFVKEDCIVVSKKKDCGACSEHCPTKAVKMVPYEKLMLPEVNNEVCVGCGACDHACPARPRKAIYVVSNRVHQKAKKPEIKKIEQSFDSKQEFPF
jgi:ferredoxin